MVVTGFFVLCAVLTKVTEPACEETRQCELPAIVLLTRCCYLTIGAK